MKLEFEIPGEPTAKGRPKLSRYGTYTPIKTKEYEEYIKACFCQYYNGEPLEGSLEVSLTFRRRIQKSGSKTVKAAKRTGKLLPVVKPDLDNYIKAVLDALNGLAYKDDAQICFIQAAKVYSDSPGVHVVIKMTEEG